jgi:hypothetical protein
MRYPGVSGNTDIHELRALLTTPFVNNRAADRGLKSLLPNTPTLGRSLRMVQWNIERGIE